jgi:glycine oxidase
MTAKSITVVGAGILGLWQALVLARAGHRVRLVERDATPFASAASRHAGAMLAPDCEAEAAPPIVRELGHAAIAAWADAYPALRRSGTLVLAAARDRSELSRFARQTTGHTHIGADALARLEPELAPRFGDGLYFAQESHVVPPDALDFLLESARATGVAVSLGSRPEPGDNADILIDCRGMAARDELPALRGVRGEQALIATEDVVLNRPVRLLHPRFPLYVVPWGDGRFLIGATMVESEDAGPVSVRSALELLGTAYALHPAFGEATILELGAGVRPSFPDNVPRALVRDGGRRILVNGAYRHGFLLAPMLAIAVRDYIAERRPHPLILPETS